MKTLLDVMRKGRMKRRYESKYVPGDDAMWRMKDGSNVGEKKNQGIVGNPDELAKKHKENTSRNKSSESKDKPKPESKPEANKEQEPRKQQDELRSNPKEEKVANPKKELVSRKTPEMPANPDDLAKSVGKPENKPKASSILDKMRDKPKDAAPKEQPKEEVAQKTLGELNSKSSEIDVYKQFKSIKENGTPALAKEYLDKVVSVKGQAYLRTIASDHGISTAKNPGGKGMDLAVPSVIRDRIIAKAFPTTGKGEPEKKEDAPKEQPKPEAKSPEKPVEKPKEAAKGKEGRISPDEAAALITEIHQDGRFASWVRNAVRKEQAKNPGKRIDVDPIESAAMDGIMKAAADMRPEEMNDPEIFKAKSLAAIKNSILDYYKSEGREKRGGNKKKQMGEEFDAADNKTAAPDSPKLDAAKVMKFVQSLDNPVLQQIAQMKMEDVSIRDIADKLDIKTSTAQRLWDGIREKARDGGGMEKFFEQKEQEGKERYVKSPIRDDVWEEIIKQSKQYPFPGEFVRCVMAAMEESQGQWDAINKGRKAYLSGERYEKEEVAVKDHDFSSTQFNIEGDVADSILAIGKLIPDKDLADDGREEEPHVTIKYGLHTSNANDVAKIIKDFGPVEVRLGKTFIFPAKEKDSQRGGGEYDVVNVEVESERLLELNKLISDSLEHTDTYPKYVPHVCIAYVKPGMGKKYAGDVSVEGEDVIFDTVLFSSKTREKTPIHLYRYEKLKGGKGDKKSDSDFDPDELAKGIKVESEHTDDKEVKKEIAKDHLTEDDEYYDKLEKIEKPTHAPRHQAPKRLDGAVARLEALLEYRDEIDEEALEDEVRGIAREFDAADLKEIARKFGVKRGLATKLVALEKILAKVCGD